MANSKNKRAKSHFFFYTKIVNFTTILCLVHNKYKKAIASLHESGKRLGLSTEYTYNNNITL